MKRRDLMSYFALGAGMLGIGYYSLKRYDPALREDQFKLVLISILSAGLGYLGTRYLRVAHCEQKDGINESFDKAFVKVKGKVYEVKSDIKESIDKKTEELWAIVQERYVTNAIKEAFEVVSGILDNLRDFGDLDNANFETPLFILLALVKKAQDGVNRKMLDSLPRESHTSTELFQLHKRIALFACEVYEASGASKPAKQAKILGLPSEKDILYKHFDDPDDKEDDHCPKFVICLDHETDSVVLSVRGTFSLTDIFIDIVCDDEEFLDGFAHRGILRGMRRALAEATPVLRQSLEERPTFRLAITGHSLGAGTAQLLAMEILSHPGKYVPKDTKVLCVALAPPPIYRSDKELPESISSVLHIYINSQDCIPRMSLGSIAALLAMVRAVDSLALTNCQKFKILTGVSDEEAAANLRLLEEAVLGINQDRFPYLEHPGQIHYLYKGPSGSGVAGDVSPKGFLVVPEKSQFFSKQILLLERMVLDHLKMYYNEAFSKAIVKGDEK